MKDGPLNLRSSHLVNSFCLPKTQSAGTNCISSDIMVSGPVVVCFATLLPLIVLQLVERVLSFDANTNINISEIRKCDLDILAIKTKHKPVLLL